MSPYQLELLGILQEECAEVIQIISKIRRFGEESFNPSDPLLINKDLLNLEVADVIATIEMIKEIPDSLLKQDQLDQRVSYKKQKVLRYIRSTPD